MAARIIVTTKRTKTMKKHVAIGLPHCQSLAAVDAAAAVVDAVTSCAAAVLCDIVLALQLEQTNSS